MHGGIIDRESGKLEAFSRRESEGRAVGSSGELWELADFAVGTGRQVFPLG